MRFIIDAMGGDNAPGQIVEGTMLALEKLGQEDEIVFVGREKEIQSAMKKAKAKDSRISIVNADEVIENNEHPVKAVRRKKESSIVVGLELVRDGKGDAFLSAGSTGALLAGGLFILGRCRGISRPALATVYPVIGKQPSLMIDVGANAECRPRNLLEFGVMGSLYMQEVVGRPDPTVGLVNNGTEEGKGTTLTKEAYRLLDESGLNFIGNIEARDLQEGIVDVIVTDGFTGNCLIKLTEGLGLMVLRELKDRFTTNMKTKLSALMMKDQLMDIKKQFNYSEYGGAPILGLKKPLLKMHGSSDALAVSQTILKAVPYVREDVVGKIEHSLEEMEEEEAR
ncbi:MAG: phosphate acyltransferase PlsX [Anaerovoracaceae bacterium]|jgi:glycerol-3-phosphate acyltransferase PlsX